MNEYQIEQLEALSQVRMHLKNLSGREKNHLRRLAGDYLVFRRKVDHYLDTHFNEACNASCYQSRLSACCSREGIVTFFADVVINFLCSEDADINGLEVALQTEHVGFKCVYLGKNGCPWRVKPIVCQMFLCASAKTRVFGKNPEAESAWVELQRERRRFTWPDRPVLFDTIEKHFMAASCSSPLMYFHNSPGLLLVKRKAGM